LSRKASFSQKNFIAAWHSFLSGYTDKSNPAMKPVVTLFKTEFSEYTQLFKQLNIHSDDVTECEFFYTYTPSPEKLPEVLNVLRQYKVAHGIQFETVKFTRRPKQNVFQSQLLSV
jgi:hypothetical protein